MFCMIACAGSTATGSYDNIGALANFCGKHNIWLHTDGAHSGAVIFSKKHKNLVHGIEMSDSVLIDFHKMLMTPSLSTALIFKDRENAIETFSQEAFYLWTEQETDEWYNSGKRTFECTKPMNVIKTYTLLRLYGDNIFSDYINTTFELASQFAIFLKSQAEFELACNPKSNIVCFRYMDTENQNNINHKIRQALINEGRFFIVQTLLNGKVFMRLSIMNPLTTIEDLKELVDLIRKIAAENKAVVLSDI